MPSPRKRLVCPDVTPYYHCVSRCVRRAFLCGQDPQTGVDVSHRKRMIEDLLLRLTQVFALEVCAYAVMSNHYHLVLFIDRQQALDWSMQETIERWHQLFRGHALSLRFLKGETLSDVEHRQLQDLAESWRQRLMDISWYMRVLNERVARKANAEDACTGRFWEGRFKSQALLDEKALLACMAYVDLNPVRAGLAKTPEHSAFTAIQKRLQAYAQQRTQPEELRDFEASGTTGIPFTPEDYIQLIDWTSRQMQAQKGAVPTAAPGLLTRMHIEPHQWQVLTQHFEHKFKGLIGAVSRLKAACAQLNYRYCRGVSNCRAWLGV